MAGEKVPDLGRAPIPFHLRAPGAARRIGWQGRIVGDTLVSPKTFVRARRKSVTGGLAGIAHAAWRSIVTASSKRDLRIPLYPFGHRPASPSAFIPANRPDVDTAAI